MFHIDEETKAQLIIVSQTIPDSVRKLTKKYLTKDFVTIDLAKGNTEEETAEDDDEEEVKFQFVQFI
jgi:superfamily II DNA/RNA helicase